MRSEKEKAVLEWVLNLLMSEKKKTFALKLPGQRVLWPRDAPAQGKRGGSSSGGGSSPEVSFERLLFALVGLVFASHYQSPNTTGRETAQGKCS